MSLVLLLVWIETSNEYNGFDWWVSLFVFSFVRGLGGLIATWILPQVARIQLHEREGGQIGLSTPGGWEACPRDRVRMPAPSPAILPIHVCSLSHLDQVWFSGTFLCSSSVCNPSIPQSFFLGYWCLCQWPFMISFNEHWCFCHTSRLSRHSQQLRGENQKTKLCTMSIN